MSLNSIFCDSITRIRNACMVKRDFTILRYSKLLINLLNLLKTEGYIDSFEIFQERKGIRFIKVTLKYYHSQSVIKKISVVSKPGCKVYTKADRIPKYMDGLGTVILSTPKGLLPDREAREMKVGGEVLAVVL
ncbi:30S ribosomal protein S8 [Candidatus Fokinia crypta]|uniref:Small ribosomal subunit protein uS8 n=1 Tax=Candidatus Fokinia crypta TaxID=1920990 RepID=A0ABZ0USS9_9RICK|nr:30S ribosomal protein S8 [Candidatus Fokinia cryptica]WPX98084.1 30S ribosomal protein S8 [Candidatus Fokinia cryptica]